MKKEVTIIGAGLVGSLLAIYLGRRNYAVTIYERRADMRKTAAGGGRSINLSLSDRGIRALEEVGIMNQVKKISIPMHGRFMHNADGTTGFLAYGKAGQYINSVSRADLNCMLMDLAEEHGATILFEHKLLKADWEKKALSFANGHEEVNVAYKLLFGSDGAYSTARLTHQLQHDRFQYNQYYIDYGYKELHISPTANGGFKLDKHALHIWPRGHFMMIALPNPDGSFTCTLFFPFEGANSFAALNSQDAVQTFFETNFADAVPLMPGYLDDYKNNPTSSLVTVKCDPWIRDDHFALIGDAAHAIVPFFGQGMNCGFEDCAVLNKLVDEYAEDWSKILPAYNALRKPDADAIADLAIQNFVEMRDKVANPVFLLQKKIEAAFSARHPGLWIPAYSLVTFSPGVRYSQALQRGEKQQRIMDEVMATPGIEQKWDTSEIENLMLNKLKDTANL